MYKRLANIFSTDKRIFGLDLMRFFAIILVVMGHSRWMTTSFPASLQKIFYGSGILGVELFFVLSGYLIGGILLKEFERNNFSLNFTTIKEFWVRRWLRTIPNYYLILMVYILLYHQDIPEGIWKYFFFLQNIWNHPPFFFEESWSLCIEEISYLISPLLLTLSVKFFSKSGKGKSTYFLYVSVALIIAVTILRLIYASYFLQTDYRWAYHFREVAAIRLDAIYYGFIAAYLAAKRPDFWKKKKAVLGIVGFTGIMVLMAFQKIIVEQYAGPLTNTFFFTFLSVAIACVLPFLSSVKTTTLQFIAKPITAISIISYSIYLLNGALLSGNLKRYSQNGLGWNFPKAILFYFLFWAVCLLLSTIIYVFFEKPITNLRSKLVKKQPVNIENIPINIIC